MLLSVVLVDTGLTPKSIELWHESSPHLPKTSDKTFRVDDSKDAVTAASHTTATSKRTHRDGRVVKALDLSSNRRNPSWVQTPLPKPNSHCSRMCIHLIDKCDSVYPKTASHFKSIFNIPIR
uniref:Transposase n=1 Tax=Steinernema glaseri TaxID=37863 RepID=A0A1I7Z112_9BILA